MIETDDREYYEGQEAYRNGLDETDNPYIKDTLAHDDWFSGWYEGVNFSD